MAEALAALGIVANISQLVDFGTRIIQTIIEFHSTLGDIPESFRHIKIHLPVLLDILRRTKSEIEDDCGPLRDETRQTILPVIEDCWCQIKALDNVLLKALPRVRDSKPMRIWKAALMVVRYKSKLERISTIIQWHLQILTCYHAACPPRCQIPPYFVVNSDGHLIGCAFQSQLGSIVDEDWTSNAAFRVTDGSLRSPNGEDPFACS
jgi:hypothetical protein